MTSPHAMPNGRAILDSFTFTTKESTMLTRLYDNKIFPVWAAIRAVLHFLGYCTRHMADGYYPSVGWYRADYDCDEHYFLKWWMPYTSDLRLHYFHEFNWRYQRYDFVYAPPTKDGNRWMWVGPNRLDNSEYENISF